MRDIVEQALIFAAEAHAGQQRKFTAEPYINHPKAVLALVRSVPHTVEMECAALLHDTVEDTDVPLHEIEARFGPIVAQYVAVLTAPAMDDRAARKAAVLRQLANAPAAAQTVKLADIIDNIHSVAERDADFARSYMAEKRAALAVLTQGDRTLRARAQAIVDEYFARQR
jgi:(p)ppGpp synthase/HD superfamily hydrolase